MFNDFRRRRGGLPKLSLFCQDETMLGLPCGWIPYPALLCMLLLPLLLFVPQNLGHLSRRVCCISQMRRPFWGGCCNKMRKPKIAASASAAASRCGNVATSARGRLQSMAAEAAAVASPSQFEAIGCIDKNTRRVKAKACAANGASEIQVASGKWQQ